MRLFISEKRTNRIILEIQEVEAQPLVDAMPAFAEWIHGAEVESAVSHTEEYSKLSDEEKGLHVLSKIAIDARDLDGWAVLSLPDAPKPGDLLLELDKGNVTIKKL